jgi:hypothetical protein
MFRKFDGEPPERRAVYTSQKALDHTFRGKLDAPELGDFEWIKEVETLGGHKCW